MTSDTRPSRMIRAPHLGRIAPGLTSLLKYQRLDLPWDLRAGLSVAAVALPVGVAYAQLAGFNPAVGLYSSILPLLAYAIFGTSRQLIIGPDAATCALVTAAVAPLASGDQQLYESLSVTLAVLAGILCIGASFLKLGALADFLSKPILAGLPHVRVPQVPLALLPSLLGDAAGLALVTFSSMMLTSRSFASKNKYDIDADREFAALGVANIASGLSQGFAVSGADSRTATSDSTGGRTQLTGLVAAATSAVDLLVFTDPLPFVPLDGLGAVLVKAALSLIDVPSLRTIYRIDNREFALSVLATLGVVAVGAIQAILVAVVLAILRFIRLVSHPKIEILGEVQGLPGFHSIERHPQAATIPGLTLLRFNAPLVFFNAPYFKRGVMAAADAAGPSLKWLVLDMLPITLVDASGLYTADEVADALRERGVLLAAAGRQTEWRLWVESRRRAPGDRKIPFYPTFGEVITAYQSMQALRSESP